MDCDLTLSPTEDRKGGIAWAKKMLLALRIDPTIYSSEHSTDTESSSYTVQVEDCSLVFRVVSYCAYKQHLPPSHRWLLHPIRHLRPHIHHRLDQILNNLRPRLLTYLLDLVEFLLRVLIRLLLGGFVARCVLQDVVSYTYTR